MKALALVLLLGMGASWDTVPGRTARTQNVTFLMYLGPTSTGAMAANSVFGQFVVTQPSLLRTMYWGKMYSAANGTGTATVDVTDTTGTSLCHFNVDCSILLTAGSGNTACGVTLAPGIYELRPKAQCAGTGVLSGFNTTLEILTP